MKKSKQLGKNIKITIVILMAVAIAFSALAPIFAAENANNPTTRATENITNEKLREEVNVFAREVQDIARDFKNTPRTIHVTKRAKGIPSEFVFRNELRKRAGGDAVRYLQKVLNLDPETSVATSGQGALGRETSYFGPATRNALLKFQKKHHLKETGILDTETRAKINEVLESGVLIEKEATEEIRQLRARIITMLNMMNRLRERQRLLREQKTEATQE